MFSITTDIQLFLFNFFYVVGDNKNKSRCQPKHDSQPIEWMNGVKQCYSKKKNEYNKAIAKVYFFHKTIDSLKLSTEKNICADVG